jgi:hypothetical protein
MVRPRNLIASERCDGIERGCLERLFEAVHVDQHVASAAGLREKITDFSGHRFDLINTLIGQSDRGERQAAIARRHQLRPRNDHGGSPLRPERGLRAPATATSSIRSKSTRWN